MVRLAWSQCRQPESCEEVHRQSRQKFSHILAGTPTSGPQTFDLQSETVCALLQHLEHMWVYVQVACKLGHLPSLNLLHGSQHFKPEPVFQLCPSEWLPEAIPGFWVWRMWRSEKSVKLVSRRLQCWATQLHTAQSYWMILVCSGGSSEVKSWVMWWP